MSHQHAICQLLIGEQMFGTGFLFSDDQRHILTARHVADKIAEALELGPRIVEDMKLTGARANFQTALLQRDLKRVVCFDTDDDWVAIELANSIRVKALPYANASNRSQFFACGFPNILAVGQPTPKPATLTGEVALLGSDPPPSVTLTATNATASCRGMSGGPVLVDDEIRGTAWIGLVTDTHEGPQGAPVYGHLNITRSEPIVASCEDRQLTVCGGRYGVAPLPPHWKWPEVPFPGLVPLSRGHARMLHGRFGFLRCLLEYVTNPAERLVIVSGRVGVGKSSLLRAGLVPYLEAQGGDIRLAIQDSNTDFVASLRALAAGATDKTVLVIDQVEECLIGRRGEGKAFARELATLLVPGSPLGCVVLGCRADYGDALEEHVRDARMLWRSIALKPLSREDIIEVLTVGGVGNKDARDHFKIDTSFTREKLEDFAGELLRDEDTNVAPLLQLRMCEMYSVAARHSSSSGRLRFDDRTYEEVAKDLSSIERHLGKQLERWPSTLEKYVESGLVHDILAFHTSAQATVFPRSWDELENRYTKVASDSPYKPPCTAEQLAELVAQMQTRSLLVDRERDPKDKIKLTRQTSIGHDALARVASQTFHLSPRPGQRCRRMLVFRLADLNEQEAGKVVLDDLDLQIVESGHSGMRVLTTEEIACVRHSLEQRRIRDEQEARRAAEEAEKKKQLDDARIQQVEAEAKRAKAEAQTAQVAAKARADAAHAATRAAKTRTRVTILVAAIVVVGLVSAFVLYRARQKTAKADALNERGVLELSSRNFAEAEVFFAHALAIRDDARTRDSLLQARRGAIVLDRRVAAPPNTTTLTATSADGECFAKVNGEHVEVGMLMTDQQRWSIDLPASNGLQMVETFAFSRSRQAGRLLALAHGSEQSHRIYVYRLEPGTPIRPAIPLGDFGGPKKRISSMVFDPGGTLLAVAADDGSLAIYDIANDKPVLLWSEPHAHTIAVHGLAFRPDGKILASGGGDYGIHFWWVREPDEKKRRVWSLWGHQDSVFGVAFNHDGTRLASGGYDRGIRIWDVEPCLEDKCAPCPDPANKDKCKRPDPMTLRILQGHEGVVETLQFSRNGAMLASASKDETLRLWDVDRARAVATFKPRVGALRSISFLDFGEPVACGGEQGWARWDTSARDEAYKLWIDGAPIYSLVIDRASKTLAVGTAAGPDEKGSIWTWELGSKDRPRRFDSIKGGVNGVAFGPDEESFAAVGEGKALVMWRRVGTEWQRVSLERADFAGPVWGLAFDPSKKYLAAGAASADGKKAEIRLWERAGPGKWAFQSAVETDHDNYALTFAAGMLISGNSHGELNLYSVPALDPTMRPHTNVVSGERNVWGLAPTPTNLVVSANSDGRVRVFEPTTRNDVARSEEPSINPTLDSVAYNAKRGAIAASGDGNQVVEYDLAGASSRGGKLEARQRFFGQEGTVWMVAYSPDGKWLSYGGLDGFIRVIELDKTDDLAAASPSKLLDQAVEATCLTVTDELTVEHVRNRGDRCSN
jgi:WD40 repeat protein